MSKYIVDIHGEIEGDYEIVRKYEEQEPCKDAVSREAAENIFVDSCIFDILLALKDGKADVEDAIKKINLEFEDEVRELPSVQPTRAKGKWEKANAEWLTCSNCWFGYDSKELSVFAYCPCCGAEMEGQK